ncbi:MAG: hypothetical protein U9N11_02540 [Campylobacterota bacterium]|nr:hypothetical protein [Campylobacterota bacterium]
MKKTLLLSVVASTMIMAGGSIAPVEPVVETPEVAASAASGWDFNGQAVVYYQTTDGQGNGSLFDANGAEKPGFAVAAAGLQLAAVNKDVIGGIGAGFELSGISDAGLFPDLVDGLVQNAGNGVAADDEEYVLAAGALTQAYLTYGAGNTSLKVGRQTLPKSLSPFAFSEGWNVFKNTFDAALLVNTDLPDTTLVGAYVTRRNNSVGNLNDFQQFHGSDGVMMLTAQNKSISGLTLTGSYYQLPDATAAGDATAVWGDAKFKLGGYSVAVQGGTIGGDAVPEDTTAFGAKIAGNVGMFGASVAYSSVDDGTLNIANLAGAGVKTPLYTQAVLNQNTIKRDSDTIKVAAHVKALGGKVIAAYITSDLGATAMGSVFGTGATGEGTYQEIELMYKTKIGQNTKLFAAFINQNDDRQADESQNFVRVWARYSF